MTRAISDCEVLAADDPALQRNSQRRSTRGMPPGNVSGKFIGKRILGNMGQPAAV
jgi:hypothetical protein